MTIEEENTIIDEARSVADEAGFETTQEHLADILQEAREYEAELAQCAERGTA